MTNKSLWWMRQCYAEYSSTKFLEQVVPESAAGLPTKFKGRLPTAKQLANAVREALPPRK